MYIVPKHKGFYIEYDSLKDELRQLQEGGRIPNTEALEKITSKLDYQICRAATYYRNELSDIRSGVIKLRHTWRFLTPQNFSTMYERYKELVTELRDILVFMEVNSDCVRRLHLMMASETEGQRLIKDKLRPDNVSSSFRELRIHRGTKELIRELHKKIDRLRFIESEWLRKGHISADFTRSVHCRRNTNFLVTELYAVAHETANRTEWYYKLMMEAEVDYESQPLGHCDTWGLFLNNLNTFLYMANYYLVIPTAAEFAVAIGMAASTSGVLLSMTPFASLFASVAYSLWSNYNFKMPLMFCNIVLIAGNLLYAMAFDAKKPWMLFAGRLLVGVGGNRAVNRRYISDFVPLENRAFQSAIFVTVGSLGMSLGPGMQPLINKMPTFVIPYLNCTFNALTAPVLIMCGLWGIFAVMTMIFFAEPLRTTAIERPELLDPLTQDPNSVYYAHYNTYLPESKLLDVSAQGNAVRGLPTGRVKNKPNMFMDTTGATICLAIYFCLKFSQEAFQTAAPIVSFAAFNWSDSEVGLLLAAIGLIVLPSNILIGWIGDAVPERIGQIASLCVLSLGFILTFTSLAPLTPNRYICGALVVFIAAQALESINMALLSRLMPKTLSKGLWNSGFLSTEAGTLGRVVGAAMISVIGSLVAVERMQDIVNTTSIILILITMWLCFFYWSSLVPIGERLEEQQQQQEGKGLEDIVDAVDDIVLKPIYISVTSPQLSLRQLKSRVGKMFDFPSSRQPLSGAGSVGASVPPLSGPMMMPLTLSGLLLQQGGSPSTRDFDDELGQPWASVVIAPPAQDGGEGRDTRGVYREV
eukprot:Blabericola_migrator_1__8682@NODE_456_length_8320_cov_227_265964_g357_i0_p1_GENE_NODE_456_length_8320_cov_227_265964_g357_i0NODE_456_length_8320_cov_227_265964_g357_i0_p1_ORF_typecomplete_len813_score88_79MFS_1/PF07690_16/3_6e27MFS_1/PF07690_16/3_2e09OATP/PF03137_20/0_032OATP/PF03137_20/11MFS_1_like/PF12832_7/20MFS_1_like/PF12832_7/0_0021WH2/PF02205_20/0_39SPW/PF03779_14/1_3e04SPW/PF03779_14/42SPW/PF03779_14/0_46_NODE_456_length_8320_cov_227_265964_g357_i024684906